MWKGGPFRERSLTPFPLFGVECRPFWSSNWLVGVWWRCVLGRLGMDQVLLQTRRNWQILTFVTAHKIMNVFLLPIKNSLKQNHWKSKGEKFLANFSPKKSLFWQSGVGAGCCRREEGKWEERKPEEEEEGQMEWKGEGKTAGNKVGQNWPPIMGLFRSPLFPRKFLCFPTRCWFRKQRDEKK